MSSAAVFAFGPGTIGVVLNVFLHGLLIAQVFYYFLNYTGNLRDSTRIRLLVVFLAIAETVNSALDGVWIYKNLILHFGDDNHLQTADWVLAADPAVIGIISTCVQIFNARRIGVIMKSQYLYAFIVFAALVSGVFGIGTAVAIHYVPRYSDFQRFQAPVAVWLISTVVCDVTTTTALTTILLLKREPRSGTRLSKVLTRLAVVTVHNGLILALWVSVDLVLYLTVPTGLHLAFNFPLGKLYSNTFLLILNMRVDCRRMLNSESFEMRTGPLVFASPTRASQQCERTEIEDLGTSGQNTPSTPSDDSSGPPRGFDV